MPARSEAGSSDASGEGDAPNASNASTLPQLVERLQTKLSGDASGTLSLSAHQSAARKISKLRSRLLLAGPDELSQKMRVALLCIGINMHRRASGSLRRAQADDGLLTEEVETEDSLLVQSLMRRTSACLMLLCSIAEWNANRREVLGDARAVMDEQRAAALGGTMLAKPPLKRDAAPDEREESERRIEAWRRAIASQPNPARVARASMRCCLHEASEGAGRPAVGSSIEAVTSEGQTASAWKRLEALAPVFFRASADAMAQRWLLPDGDVDFVSLEAAPIARYDEATRARKLRSIAQSAESEAGQGVARALMLSFLLPASIIGTRRTLLLSREANTKATLDHPQEVERAHNMAYALRILTSNRACIHRRRARAGWRAPSGSSTRARTTSSAAFRSSPESRCSRRAARRRRCARASRATDACNCPFSKRRPPRPPPRCASPSCRTCAAGCCTASPRRASPRLSRRSADTKACAPLRSCWSKACRSA